MTFTTGQTVNELMDILKRPLNHEPQDVIEAIDDLVLNHWTNDIKPLASSLILDIKWIKQYPNHYTVGDPPDPRIYADVISYYGFWQGQKMFGKAKSPYLLED